MGWHQGAVPEWVEPGLGWVWPGWAEAGRVKQLGLDELGSGEQGPGWVGSWLDSCLGSYGEVAQGVG